MDLTIFHIVLVHERRALCLDTLVTTHVLIVVIVPRVGTIFSGGASYPRFEPRHLDDPHFSRHGSRPTCSNGEVQKTVKTSSGHIVKCWVPKFYLTNPSTEPSTSSYPM
jgi:hypothetical protein